MKRKFKVVAVITLFSLIFLYGCNIKSQDTVDKEVSTEKISEIKETSTENHISVNAKSQNTVKSNSDYIKDEDIDIVKTISEGRFCYSQLNNEQKLCYEKLRKAIEQQRNVLYWNNDCCSPATIDMLLLYITYDYPEYFWYSDENCYAERNSTDNNIIDKVIFKYEYNRDEVYQISNQIYKVVTDYLESVSNITEDYDKAIITYEYIINNTRYDNIRANAGYNSFEEMDSDALSCWNISGVFLNHNAICRGYVQAYQYLMNLQGIECGYVYGENHCWNIIKLDGDWYYTDITWGDPVLRLKHNDTGVIEYIEQGIDYSYFCMTTEQLLQIHQPDYFLNLDLPECTATKDNYFVKNKNSDKNNYFS